MRGPLRPGCIRWRCRRRSLPLRCPAPPSQTGLLIGPLGPRRAPGPPPGWLPQTGEDSSQHLPTDGLDGLETLAGLCEIGSRPGVSVDELGSGVMVQIAERVGRGGGVWTQDRRVPLKFIGHPLVLLDVDPLLGSTRLDEMVRAEEPRLDEQAGLVDLGRAIPELLRFSQVGLQRGHSRTNYATRT